MRNPVYRPQWMIVLTSVVVAGMSVASGDTLPVFFEAQHPAPAGQTLSASGVPALHGIVDSGRNADLRWSDFTSYKTEVAKLYETNGYSLLWVQNGRVRPQGLAVIELLQNADAKGLDPENYGGTVSASSATHEYRLRFYHTHTGERLDVVYRRGDQYIPEALDELDHFLRDHRTGDVRHFDPRLFDLLYDLTASLGDSGAEIDVICGYRTPWSNEFLRTRNPHTGVAQHSLHMQAEAIDIRLHGTPTSELRDAALRLHRGGVGYYRSSDFVHVDVGRVRHW